MIKMKKYDEKIYGNLATVFHRTSYSNLINAIYTNGFKPRSGSMYGKGFYSTYDLASQERNNMANTYGKLVIKFSVSIENFFIFDYSEFIKSPNYRKLKSTEEKFIQDQIKHFGIEVKENYRNRNTKYSSSTALWLYKNSDLNYKTQGVIFTGSRDGKVLVAYETKIIIPLAYKVDGETEFSKVDRNKEYLKQVLKKKLAPFTGIELPNWFKKANKTDWKAGLIDKIFIWEYGIWKNGTWEDGIWRGGIWEDGIWKNGTWRGGTWQWGIWEDGIWKNGIWKNGTWRGGTWKDGTWKDGIIFSKKFKSFVKSSVNPEEFYKLEQTSETKEQLEGLVK